MKRCLAPALCVLLLSVVPPMAQERPTTPVFSGWAWVTLGQIVSSDYQKLTYDYDLAKQPLGGFDVGLKATKDVGSYSKVRVHAGLSLVFLASDYHKANAEFLAKRFAPYMIDATLQSSFAVWGGRDTLQSEIGYFPVKYNPQSRNLGEYLFRSGTYPGYLVSGFELADKVKVGGFHLSYKWVIGSGWIKAEFYHQIETDNYPVLDQSLTQVLSGGVSTFAEMGAGASFSHYISYDKRRTTPSQDTVVFRKNIDMQWIGYSDPETGDTTYYTFRGIKLMGRLTIDPKRLFGVGRPRFLGKEDLKLYSEAAVLGLENYPGWYEHIKERVPVMVGFNIPAFKVLDVLAIEGEWYGSRYWNSQEYIWKSRSPVPYTGQVVPNIDTWEAKENNHYKWSIYASRKIANVVRISGQVACDHWARNILLPPPPSFTNYTEVTPRTRDWYWMLRAMYSF